jgi:hypothetical protein
MKHGKMCLVIMMMIQIQFLITFYDTNTIFNNLSNTFHRKFYPSCPKKRIKTTQNSNVRITTGIKTSCNNYKILYLLCRESNVRKLKIHYSNYCKTLYKVITSAKIIHYYNEVADSSNKPKTTWSIMETIINNMKNCNNILMMQIYGKITSHYITLNHVTSHSITLHQVTPHYIKLHHITSRYITLYHITSH